MREGSSRLLRRCTAFLGARSFRFATLLYVAPILGASSSFAQSEPPADTVPAEDAALPAIPDEIILDEGDDEIIVIEDESDGSFPDDDDIIILEEGEDPEPTGDVPITGALGRLWESWHVAADSRAETLVQAVQPEDGFVRAFGFVALETWLLPAPNLSFYANGFGRAFVDATTNGSEVFSYADLYEAYAKINAEVGSVQLGRLIVPYGKTQVASFGDRLNPPDHRRGWELFPDPAAARHPQWGGWIRTSLGALSLDGVLLLLYEPTEGSLAASDQGGVRIGRYQTALGQSPARFGGLLSLPRRERLLANQEFPERASLGVRARRRLGDFDVGASFVWGPDETPTLALPRDVGRFLARDVLLAMGASPLSIPTAPCAGAPTEIDCLGGAGTLAHVPTGSFAGDVSWGLGVIILRAELLVQPQLGGLPGKTAIIVDPALGLTSTRLGHFAGGLAVEGGLGEWVVGSIELFDVVWVDVPAGANLYGVELIEPVLDDPHTVHRLAVGVTLAGTLLEERLSWQLRGEGGIVQQDILTGLEVRYRLPVLNLYVGVHGAVFAGAAAGSPGWLRKDATQLGIFVGEGG